MRNLLKNQTFRRLISLMLALCMFMSSMVALADSGDSSAAAEELTLEQTAIRTNNGNYYYYILSVATGSRAGNDVMFFKIDYLDADGKESSEYIFPHIDGKARSDKWVKASRTGISDKNRYKTDLYSLTNGTKDNFAVPTGVESNDALRPFSTDEFCFATTNKIKKVTNIAFFGSVAGSWSCKGMQVYAASEVDNNLSYNGTLSNYMTIDFKGFLLASAKCEGNYAKWDTSGFINFGKNPSFGNSQSGPTNKEYKSYEGKNAGIAIKIADLYEAGLESWVQAYDQKVKFGDLKLPDVMVLIVEYVDVNGNTISIEVPAIRLALIWLAQQNIYDKYVQGYAQQGENIVFSMFLKGCDDLSTVKCKLQLTSSDDNEIAFFSKDTTRNQTLKEGAWADEKVVIESIALYDLSADSKAMSAYVPDNSQEGSAMIHYNFGTPSRFWLANSKDGKTITPGSSPFEFFFEDWRSGAFLSYKKNSSNSFLVSLTTDTSLIGSNTGEMMLSLNYVDTAGAQKWTSNFSVKDAVNDFYGYWVGNKDDFAYRYGLDAGNTMSFVVDVANAEKFTGLALSMVNNEGNSWQVKNIRIWKLVDNGWVDRSLTWMDVGTDSGLYTNRIINRSVVTYGTSILDYDTSLLFKENDTKKIDFDSNTVTEITKPDMSEYYYNMSYEDTLKDFGFAVATKTYAIKVEVGSENDGSTSNGDAGSRNNFFFQLCFADGRSGYVLANQQLTADGFRTGETEMFNIAVNMNYGTLLSVNIIPEEISDDMDAYDKLYIKKITVSEKNVSGFSKSYEIGDVGWIGIDYHDEGEMNAIGGREGKEESELAKNYLVTANKTEVSFEFALTTGLNNTDQPDFCGQLSATINYYDKTGIPKSINVTDVVQLMYEYAGFSYRDAYPGPASSFSTKSLCVGNPDSMFRQNHTDRFEVQLSDISSLRSIEFYAYTDKDCRWNPTNLSVNVVKEAKPVRINNNREYEKQSKYLLETPILCSSTTNNKEIRTQSATIADGEKDGSGGTTSTMTRGTQYQTFSFEFGENQIDIDEEKETVAIPLYHIPEGSNDEINVFIYPSVGGDAAELPTTAKEGESVTDKWYDMDLTVSYGTTTGKFYNLTEKGLRKALVDGQPVYYVYGLSVRNWLKLKEVIISSSQSQSLIDHIVVQHVKNGVVLDDYYVNGYNRNAQYTPHFTYATGLDNPSLYRQIVMLQVSVNDPDVLIVPEEQDMAVALNYKSQIDFRGNTFRSPYIYLSDQQIKKIKGGGVLTLNFDIPFVGDITGITMMTGKNLKVNITSACIGNYKVNSNESPNKLYTIEDLGTNEMTLVNWFSFAGSALVTNNAVTLSRADANADYEELHKIQPLIVNVTTREATDTMDPSSTTPIEMKVKFADMRGVGGATLVYDDISRYTETHNEYFEAGTTEKIVMLTQGIDKLESISFRPHDKDETTNASWGVSKVEVKLPLSKTTIRRNVVQPLFYEVYDSEAQAEEQTTISLLDIGMTTYAVTYAVVVDSKGDLVSSNEPNTIMIKKGMSEDVVVVSGQKINFQSLITGTIDESTTMKVERIIDDTALEVENLYHSEVFLDPKDQKARSILVFDTPQNTKDEIVTYKLTICSFAEPSTQTVLNVKVLPEEKTETVVTPTPVTPSGDGSGGGSTTPTPTEIPSELDNIIKPPERTTPIPTETPIITPEDETTPTPTEEVTPTEGGESGEGGEGGESGGEGGEEGSEPTPTITPTEGGDSPIF